MNSLAETAGLTQPIDRPDEGVLADICDRLWQDKTTRDSERSALAIEVRDGQVLLLGHITTRRYAQHVVELVRRVRGAWAICDALVAEPDLVTEVT